MTASPGAPTRTAGRSSRMRFSQDHIVLMIATLIFALFALTLPGFAAPGNLLSLLQSLSILGVLGIGMSLTIIGRGIDLAMISTMAIWNTFWRIGDHAMPVPPVDGALRPNARLDAARLMAKVPGVDNAAVWLGKLVFSAGADLMSLSAVGEAPKVERTFGAPVSAIAADGAWLAVALKDGALIVDDKAAKLHLKGGSVCALSFGHDQALLIAVGSLRHRAGDWCVDLMERGTEGAAFRLGADGSVETLAERLHHAGGIAEARDGRVLVSESWNHRIVALSGGTVTPVVWDLIALSGGNQQKVVIASGLVQRLKLVIFDEPTLGVDVGAISEIHALIRNPSDEGLAVLLISSCLPKIISLSDRILVARLGRVVEEFVPGLATKDNIMQAAVH